MNFLQHFISTLLLAGVVLAAPEAPISGSNSGPYPASTSNEAPYPPSGWKPSGRLLLLPAKQQVAPVYGTPSNDYGTPASTENEATTPEYNPTTITPRVSC